MTSQYARSARPEWLTGLAGNDQWTALRLYSRSYGRSPILSTPNFAAAQTLNTIGLKIPAILQPLTDLTLQAAVSSTNNVQISSWLEILVTTTDN